MTHVFVRIPFGRAINNAMYFYVSYLSPQEIRDGAFQLERRYDWDDTSRAWIRSDW